MEYPHNSTEVIGSEDRADRQARLCALLRERQLDPNSDAARVHMLFCEVDHPFIELPEVQLE